MRDTTERTYHRVSILMVRQVCIIRHNGASGRSKGPGWVDLRKISLLMDMNLAIFSCMKRRLVSPIAVVA